jgi:gamma-glutamylcyclotransferase (GGCT)/AIG2-like uncharacterized protein YtfP
VSLEGWREGLFQFCWRQHDPKTHLYFAYGSNLDGAQMRRRCPSARLVGAAILDGYRLGFAGRSASWGGAVATVVRDREGRVPGLVWAVSADDLERLDRCEGATEHRAKRGAQGGSTDRAAGGFAYRRKRLLVETGEARRRRVHVYVKDDAEQALPTEAYLGVIWRAYRRHGFDEQGLSLALGGER